MSDISFEEIKDEIYQYLLESDEPVYHIEIEEQTGLSHREVGQALMCLFDEDKIDWPAGDKWIAKTDNTMTIKTTSGEMRIEYE